MHVPGGASKQSITRRYERAALLVFLLILIAVRIPNVWIYGRFWAEEGSVFFANAWNMPWWRALLADHANYLNLTANIAGLLAVSLTTLPAAPYVTTTFAILIQCLPIALLATSREQWLQNRFVLLVAMLIIVLAPAPEEVWANSANSHVHLTLCAALILAFETRTGAIAYVYGSLLLLAALSGPYSWFLLPLYALRAAIDRSKLRALQGLTLMLGVMIQLIFFSTLEQREIGASPSLIGAIVMAKHLLLPFLGKLALLPVPILRILFESGQGPLWPLIVVLSMYLLMVSLAAARPNEPPLWFLLAAAMVAGAGYLGGIDRKVDLINATAGGGRHSFTPQVLIGLALLSWTVIHSGRLRIVSAVLVAWILLLGAYNYFVPSWQSAMTGPNWRQEVALWRSDPNHRLQIWPAGWSTALAPK
jgi:hypothetical protein